MGIFFHCTTCFRLSIHNDCAFLPKKLPIPHTHPLILSYSFPGADLQAKFFPKCRICNEFFDENLWIYKCEKCRYYAHLDCATSRGEPFMSIFLPAGLGKTVKNFEDADHPDLLNLPFPDQTYSIPQHKMGSRTFETDEGNLNHISHEHLLSLVQDQHPQESIRCHNPMKKIEQLCNGCLRPITSVPFFKCADEDQCCNFVLHEWCTRLPAQVQKHPGHPEHTLILLPNVSRKLFGVFYCDVCGLCCNGFAYGCEECDYYIDVSCGFIPEKITHKAHPNHLLSRVDRISGDKNCHACLQDIYHGFCFRCHTCDNLHLKCALLLPQTIMHKYDKHPMNLSYLPIENHKSEYFCEICEEALNPKLWFYRCYECVQSVHSDCAPSILQSETAFASYSKYDRLLVYAFLNIKFRGILNIEGQPHSLLFAQGIKTDGRCIYCFGRLEHMMIFKCFRCKLAFHYLCLKRWGKYVKQRLVERQCIDNQRKKIL